MAKVMQCALSSGSTTEYAVYTFPSAQDEIYITLRVAWNSIAHAYFDDAFNYSGDFVDPRSAFGGGLNGVFVANNSGSPGDLEWQDEYFEWGPLPTPTPLADTWFDLEFHVKNGNVGPSVSETWINGTLMGSNDSGWGATLFYGINVGQKFGFTGGLGAGAKVFIDDVKVGTTRGGSDIFADSFESNDFSAWTSTTGAVSVVDDPYAASGDLGTGTITATSTMGGVIQLRGILGSAGPILATSTVSGAIRFLRISGSITATSTASGTVAKQIRLRPSTITATSSLSAILGRKIFIHPTSISAFSSMTTFVDDIIVYVPEEVFTDPGGPGYPLLGPAAANPDGYFIDTLSHGFEVTQTYRGENLRFKQIIREVQDADWEISTSQVDSHGNPIVWRRISDNADFMLPWQNGFRIRYKEAGVETPIMAGVIKSTNAAKGRDYIKVAGLDWLGYLDHRQIPFNPLEPTATYADANFFGPSTPPTGFSYQVAGRDIFRIVHDILEFVLSKPRSLPLDISDPGTSFMGTVINYALALGDTSTALNLITGLSEYWPGFDFIIGYNRNFAVFSPARFGDPDDTANSGPDGDNIAYTFGDDFNHPVMDIEYTNAGVQSTHVLGTGAGTTANRVSKAIGAGDIQRQFWRLDDSVDFGDQAKTQDIVAMRTRREFIFRAREIHEIELTIDPQTVENFHTVIKVGYAIWLRDDLQIHEIDSAQKIISIEMTVDKEGNRTAVLGLNQIYDTSNEHYGVNEA